MIKNVISSVIALFFLGTSLVFSQQATITIEAEDFSSSAPEIEIQDNASASNGKTINQFKGNKWVMYTVNVEKAGTYSLSIFAANLKKEESNVDVMVNRDKFDGVKIAVTGKWTEIAENKVSNVTLKSGKNTIKVTQKTSLSSKLDKLTLTLVE